MIRQLIEQDISLVEHALADNKKLKTEDDKSIIQAWIRIQLWLYRCDALLEQLDRHEFAHNDFNLGYYLELAKSDSEL